VPDHEISPSIYPAAQQALPPDALRVNKVGAILRARISYKDISIYQCGAGEAQGVGPL
jgi:hypothetical protein